MNPSLFVQIYFSKNLRAVEKSSASTKNVHPTVVVAATSEEAVQVLEGLMQRLEDGGDSEEKRAIVAHLKALADVDLSTT